MCRFQRVERLGLGLGRFFALTVLIVAPLTVRGPAQTVRDQESHASVDFNDEIRPILASKCFKCHGPDEYTREAGLRLDTAAGATEDRGGYRAVEPGDPDASELLLRVTSDDPGMRMPPPESGETLSESEIAALRHWIAAGGEYQRHWAFAPPERPQPAPQQPAALQEDHWSRDPVDTFVRQRLRSADLAPSSEADRWTLVRRLYLDVLGLPPTPEQAAEFVNDDSPMAYAKLVDRLQAHPAQAERQARPWLDLARYADTNGYEKDRPRSIWPYRDWVLDALARDMPYDQFTIEQLAGDMLPDADVQTRIATGFQRNTMLNEEGGIDPLEYRFYAMVDRVNTIGTVWMGMTIGCAQCHTHKYDPITHEDYYALMALINNADEPEVVVDDAQAADELAAYHARLDALFLKAINRYETLAASKAEDASEAETPRSFEAALGRWVSTQRDQLVEWITPRPERLESTLPKLRLQEDGSIFADGDATKRDEYALSYAATSITQPVTALRLEVLPDPRLPAGGPGRSYYEGRRGDFFLSELRVIVDGQPIPLHSASHSYGNLSVGSGTADAENVIDGNASTGWSTSLRPGQPHRLVVNLAQPVPAGSPIRVEMLFERHFAASLGRFRIDFAHADADLRVAPLASDTQQQLAAVPSVAAALGRAPLRTQLERDFVLASPLLAEARKPIEKLLDQRPQPTTSMVLRERADDNRRPTYRHHRGEYLKAEERVEGRIPTLFAPLLEDRFGEDGPSDRLELARWLVSPSNPLVARVTANRQWRLHFGSGLVRTAGDFGTQVEPPTYPRVLDALAVGFMEHDWSVKRLQRRILLSATYRQSSAADAQRRQVDPDNRLLSRGPRFRLDAEVIRDAALLASGQLSREFGGPSVRPPQPDAVTALAYGSPAWKVSTGGDRYRRSLYTFAKRTAPFAAYSVFDAPTRETCLARRDRSNTPLQSLTLLNDPMFVELAEAAAERLTPPPTETTARARQLFQTLLTRPPSDAELAEIVKFVARVGSQPSDPSAAADRDNVWMLVARALMNTDEAITKE
jgi:mono/diheme cytochrome c family protein